MKKILIILIYGTIIYSCSSTRITNDDIKYFDENNIEISKTQFYQKSLNNKLLSWAYIPEGSKFHKKITLREERGKITNRPLLELMLEKETNRELDSDKPLIIVYYPGKDPCNSSGSATKKSRKVWFGELENGINQITQTKPIYIYKNSDGLEKYQRVLTWHNDPEGTVEKLFFKYHYPCSSFVVISKDGDYISYFGEFGKEYVWEATQLMNK